MSSQTKRRRPSRQIQPPTVPKSRSLLYAGAAGAVVVIAGVFALTTSKSGDARGHSSAGLPNTPDYHALVVDPSDPRKLILGTHTGL